MEEITKGDIVYDQSGYKYKVHIIADGGYYCYPFMTVHNCLYPDFGEIEEEFLGETLTFLTTPLKFAPIKVRANDLKDLENKLKSLNLQIYEKEKELKELEETYENKKKTLESSLGDFTESYELIQKIENNRIKYVIDSVGNINDFNEVFGDNNSSDSYYASISCRCYKGKYIWHVSGKTYMAEDFFETYEDAKKVAEEKIKVYIEKRKKESLDGTCYISCEQIEALGLDIPKEFIDNNTKYFEKQKQYYENLVKTCDSKITIEKNRKTKVVKTV